MTKTSPHAFLLVKADGSFNPSEIMKAAWREMRRPNHLFPDAPRPSFAECLRFVWNEARQQRASVLPGPVSHVTAEPGEYADSFVQWARDVRERNLDRDNIAFWAARRVA